MKRGLKGGFSIDADSGQNAFLTSSWRFKLEKNIGIKKHAGKVRKYFYLTLTAIRLGTNDFATN